MDSNGIQPQAADELRQRIRPALAFLGRLRQRMEHRGFPPDDRAYQAVSQAYVSMQALHVELHYLSCEHGVGRELSRERQGASAKAQS